MKLEVVRVVSLSATEISEITRLKTRSSGSEYLKLHRRTQPYFPVVPFTSPSKIFFPSHWLLSHINIAETMVSDERGINPIIMTLTSSRKNMVGLSIESAELLSRRLRRLRDALDQAGHFDQSYGFIKFESLKKRSSHGVHHSSQLGRFRTYI